MEAGMLGSYCLSKDLLCLFCVICVRNGISWFSVMFPFLMIAMLHLLGLSTRLHIVFFLRYGCEISNITLHWTVRYLTHSKNCPCNDVNPDWKPDEIEELLCTPSGQGLQVRPLGENWKGCWKGCVSAAVLDLQCSVLHWELPISASLQRLSSESAQQQYRYSRWYLLCSHPSTPEPGAGVVLHSNASRLDVCFMFSQCDCTVETFSQLLLLSRGNKLHQENTNFFSFWF